MADMKTAQKDYPDPERTEDFKRAGALFYELRQMSRGRTNGDAALIDEADTLARKLDAFARDHIEDYDTFLKFIERDARTLSDQLRLGLDETLVRQCIEQAGELSEIVALARRAV